jgi:hypothetical protein
MFVPKIAKAKTKASDSPTRKLAPQFSTLVARPLGGGAVEQVRMLQGTIRNQAMLRYLTQRLSNLPANGAAERHGQEAAPENMMAREAPRGSSWDFSKIPVFPPDRADRPQSSSLRAATPLPGAIQAKLVVGQANDPLEHQADRVAKQVMRMPDPTVSTVAAPPQVSRKCAACEEEEAKTLQSKRTGAPAPSTAEAPGSVHAVLGSPGQRLDAATRAFFEPRFGHDFTRVRVHADARAAISAAEVGARAYAVGKDIVFGAGEYEPRKPEGQRLLAHELVHVIQQAAGPPFLARQTVEQYQTQGITIDRAELNKVAELTYWNQKLQDYGFNIRTQQRLTKNREELDAVLSVVWQVRPQPPTITHDIIQVVNIPKRQARGSQDLAYLVTFHPPTVQGQRGIVDVDFVAEAAGGAPVVPAGTSTTFRPKTQGGYSHGNFPGNDVTKYWVSHREEERRVFNWVENSAGQHFDQILTLTTGSGAQTQSASFHVKGSKDPSGKVSDLVIVFIAPVAASQQTVPHDYASHDFADESIEKAQTTLDPVKQDKLGNLINIDKVPADEGASVKYAIWQYFVSNTKTRNAEVHAIVPIADKPGTHAGGRQRRVLYTFRFLPTTNDVDVHRVGEEGKDVSLVAEGSLARVDGYAAHAQGATEQDQVKSLTAWLKQRYPGLTPAASDTIANLEKDVTAQIRVGSGEEKWFDANYGIKILTAAEAGPWLAKKLGYDKPEDLQDLLNFMPAELKMLELVFERMSDATLSRFRWIHMVRQKVYFEWTTKVMPAHFEKQEHVAGITRGTANRTINIFDAAFVNIDALFIGSIGAGIAASPAMTSAHELGHVTSYAPGMQKAFDKLVADKHIKPVTWYAASNPPKELFPEAFALYYLDPEWLKTNWPDLFDFFDALDKAAPPQKPSIPKKTGKPQP